MNNQFQLFPAIEPNKSGYLRVDDTHELYWEECGNPNGTPILFVHGGPGAGSSPIHRQFFDPQFYRIIVFDQRGAGRSKPIACIKDNTFAHLKQDIEKLREFLNIKKWHVFGGSWGSTLSIGYAIDNPERCISLILRGIFLIEKDEIEWFINGMKNFYPEEWQKFSNHIDKNKRDDLLNAYYELLKSDDDTISIPAARIWDGYESACAYLFPQEPDNSTSREADLQHLALSRIEAHFFVNESLNETTSMLNKIDRIRHIPATIIQGRYDVICPPTTAYRLHQAWPEANYVIVTDSGHSALDPALTSRLIEATEKAKALS